ncbi:MAG: FAD-binding domain-containing protein [Pseudomonadota bacterium]
MSLKALAAGDLEALKAAFPAAATRDQQLADWPAGAAGAKARMEAISPQAYEKSRNYVDGKVSRLSPYIRHGVVELAAVRDAALDKVGKPKQAFKFVQELAWRDYWLRVYDQIGDDVWEDQEPYKTGFQADDYAGDLPEDIMQGETGINFIDAWSRELVETGYLHNHVRMYMAAYVVHFRRVKWQAGAAWFLTHLLDGDPASNNLSWQWVASTFSHKPYIFNLDNVDKYTNGVFAANRGKMDPGVLEFGHSYEVLANRLFPYGQGN